jgi:hypothetical protein
MRIILFFLSCCLFNSCFSQTNRYWLPKNFVEACIERDTSQLEKYLIPIEGFVTNDGLIKVVTYRGELSNIETENDNGVLRLKNVAYYINQKYLPKDSVNSYEKKQFSVFLHGDNLFLEIKENGSIKKITFVDRIGNFTFTDLRKTKVILRNWK